MSSGWATFRLGEYKQAIGDFSAAREAAEPGSDTHLQAAYGLATTWDLRQPQTDQDDALATSLYEELIEADPGHDLAAWSSLALVRMKHLVQVGEETDYEAVRRGYQEVIDRYPDHLAGHEALMYQQSTHVMTLKEPGARRAIERLEAFVASHPDSQFLSLAHVLISNGYAILEQPEKQLEAAIRSFDTMEIDPTNPFQDNAARYWVLATTAEFEAGDFVAARTYYQRLVDEYPADVRTFSAEQSLLRMDALEESLRHELMEERAAGGGAES